MQQFKNIEEIVGYFDLFVGDFTQEGEDGIDGLLFTSRIASLSHGKESPKNPRALALHLLKKGHFSPFEFWKAKEGNLREVVERIVESMGWEGIERWIWMELKEVEPHPDAQMVPIFRIKCPLPVATHFWRHRSFSFLSISRRFVKDVKEALLQGADYLTRLGIPGAYARALDGVWAKQILENQGVPAELSRMVLPQFVFYDFYMTIFDIEDIFGWANFFVLRVNTHAQFETSMIAYIMLKRIKEKFPKLAQEIEREAFLNPLLEPHIPSSIFALGEAEFLERMWAKRERIITSNANSD